jgi:hypothetical protein
VIKSLVSVVSVLNVVGISSIKDIENWRNDKMKQKTKTIRVSNEAIAILILYGGFGDNYSDCINKMHQTITDLKQKLERINDVQK